MAWTDGLLQFQQFVWVPLILASEVKPGFDLGQTPSRHPELRAVRFVQMQSESLHVRACRGLFFTSTFGATSAFHVNVDFDVSTCDRPVTST